MDIRSTAPEKIAEVLTRQGGLLLDTRAPDDYLAAHIRGSISMLYEAGPGFGTRARDLLPLDAPLVLVEDPDTPLDDAARRLRGKGYDVVGYLAHETPWKGEVVTTEEMELSRAKGALKVVDVYDPGTQQRDLADIAIPAERLWERYGELDTDYPLAVLTGWGVRAAAAVGILESLGFSKVSIIRTRAKGEIPAMAGDDVFRVGGPG